MQSENGLIVKGSLLKYVTNKNDNYYLLVLEDEQREIHINGKIIVYPSIKLWDLILK